jgi:hypothetical protein
MVCAISRALGTDPSSSSIHWTRPAFLVHGHRDNPRGLLNLRECVAAQQPRRVAAEENAADMLGPHDIDGGAGMCGVHPDHQQLGESPPG